MSDTPFLTLGLNQPFHGYYDTIAGTVNLGRQVTVTTRELSYNFFTHFHPYAAELISRLVKDSVRGLQAADTDYQANPDGTLKPLADSTRAALTKDTQVTLVADGKPKVLPTSMRVTLPDGTGLTLKVDGTQVHIQLPGSIYGASGSTSVTLSGNVFVTSSGGTQVTVNGQQL